MSRPQCEVDGADDGGEWHWAIAARIKNDPEIADGVPSAFHVDVLWGHGTGCAPGVWITCCRGDAFDLYAAAGGRTQ
jgi:hypothetical protein